MDGQQRIAVIGCSGAGKSTLARVLAEVTGLPVIHLDKEHWQPGWTEPDKAGWTARTEAFAAAPSWIIDGQYGHSLEGRLARATLIVWLDLPTWTCLVGAVRRWWQWRGRTRPDMGPDCPEKIDAAFLHWILSFRRLVRPGVARAVAASGTPVVRLTSARARNRWIAALRARGLSAVTAGPG